MAYWVDHRRWLSAVMGPERLHLQRCIDHPDAPQPQARDAATKLISLEAEVPEVLLVGMREFLAQHPQWDQKQLLSSALASFLFQNGSADKVVSQHYLDGLFRRA